jgi:glycosyltransferase involved in cell wall biosynthesis
MQAITPPHIENSSRRRRPLRNVQSAPYPRRDRVLVSAIVRSTGDGARTAQFKRAVLSVLSQTGVTAECIVVFNGARYDTELLAWAKAQRNTRCAELSGADKPAATLVGRSLVRGEYFCYIDDDDEFLPEAFSIATGILERDPDLDCVAANGFYVTPSGVRSVFREPSRFSADGYVESLLRSRNWLAAGGGMFRSATVGHKYFENLPRHREWTVVAYRVATDLRVCFVNRLLYRIYSSAESESKKRSYVEGAVITLRAMIEWTLEPAHAHVLRVGMGDAYRNIASFYRVRGEFTPAWRAYWEAVRCPGGIKHLPYGALLLTREKRVLSDLFRWRPGQLEWHSAVELAAVLLSRAARPAKQIARRLGTKHS